MLVALKRAVAVLVIRAGPAVSTAASWLVSSVDPGGSVMASAAQPALLFLVQVVLACLGVLLGSSWTIQALQTQLRRQAEERRRLNEEWPAVRAIRWQRSVCPRCASPLHERNWYIAPTLMEDPPGDDD